MPNNLLPRCFNNRLRFTIDLGLYLRWIGILEKGNLQTQAIYGLAVTIFIKVLKIAVFC